MSCDLHIEFEGECHESDCQITARYTQGDKTPEKRAKEVITSLTKWFELDCIVDRTDRNEFVMRREVALLAHHAGQIHLLVCAIA